MISNGVQTVFWGYGISMLMANVLSFAADLGHIAPGGDGGDSVPYDGHRRCDHVERESKVLLALS